MSPWLFGRASTQLQASRQTELAMVAARAGDRVVVIGAGDPVLSAELARVTGLNGQITVMDDAPGARARTERAAARLGALVPFEDAAPTALTAAANTADIAVLVRRLGGMNEPDRQTAAAEALRVVRPGGRLTVIEGGSTSGVFTLWRRAPTSLDAEAVRAVLTAGGWKASRVVGEAGGAIYIEATKPRV